MDIDSDKTKALYQLSLDKTYTKAAVSLGISQPALSKKIVRLEEDLETTLVIRGSKGIYLTETGNDVVRYYLQKRDLEQELLQQLSHQDSRELIGNVAIGTYSSLGRSALIPSLSPIVGSHPNLRINYYVKEIRNLKAMLLSGECHFIISNEIVNRTNIISDKIGEEENIHITPKTKKFPDFFLDHDPDDQTTFSFLKLQKIPIAPIKRNYFDDVYGIIDAVNYGYGQAIVSKHLIYDQENIRIIKHKNRYLTPIYLSYFNRPYFPKVHKEIIDQIRKSFHSFL